MTGCGGGLEHMCSAMDMCGERLAACKYEDGGMDMYIVTIREKGNEKPVFEQECSCVIGATGDLKNGYIFTALSGQQNTLTIAYACVLKELKHLDSKFPGLLDDAIKAAKSAESTAHEEGSAKQHVSFRSRLFGR